MSFNPHISLTFQDFSPELRFREFIPLTRRHTETLPASTVISKLKLWINYTDQRIDCPVCKAFLGDPQVKWTATYSSVPAGFWEAPGSLWSYTHTHHMIQYPQFTFRSQVYASFTRRLLAGPVMSVTRDQTVCERSPLCDVWMKNTPFRERIQLVFHRERRQPQWKGRTMQIIHQIFT